MLPENVVYQGIINHIINMHKYKYRFFFHVARKNVTIRDMNVYFFSS